MKPNDEEFRKKLLRTFAIEAREHLHALSSRLMELEKTQVAERSEGLVEAAFREAHSLKGAARAVDAVEIESVCRALESVFARLKEKEVAPSAPLLDPLHEAVNLLEELLAAPAALSAPKGRVAEVVRCLEDAARSGAPRGSADEPAPEAASPRSTQAPGEAESPGIAETVRTSAAKLDRLLLQAEELISCKLTALHRASEAQEALSQLSARRKQWTRIQSDLRRLQQYASKNGAGNGPAGGNGELRKVLEFLEQEHGFERAMEHTLGALVKGVAQDARALARAADSLLDETKQLRVLPFSTLLESFPRFIRNLSREQNKDVELVLHGAEIEMDRRILEEMKDPLIHLLRNCMDHGIEPPGERAKKNKPRRGAITLAVTPKETNRVEILISDDGCGIDSSKVLAVARRRGLSVEDGPAENGDAALSLIFESGVSTSPIITDISGRGLGLAIARERVEKLGGTITVETQAGHGTAFRILLPLSIATFRGALLRTSGRIFVLPVADVERMLHARRKDIQTVENRETIAVNGQTVALACLADLLGLPRTSAPADAEEKFPVAIIRVAGKRLGLQVDEVVGEQEVLVKGLGQQLRRVRNVSAATVLGAGQVTPILNASDLMKAAMSGRFRLASPAPAAPGGQRRKKTILVVEDSITARTLLKNILEAAGYAVETAVDGVEAFTMLRTVEFDLVVSDVDMPRMNGLDLTARIRADKKLAELPVVLVTALESREDRERGIDFGATAYIVKSSFEQSNLLEVVRQLL